MVHMWLGKVKNEGIMKWKYPYGIREFDFRPNKFQYLIAVNKYPENIIKYLSTDRENGNRIIFKARNVREPL